MAGLAQRVARSASLRGLGIAAYRAIARAAVVYPPPRVLANGIPKAGTHVLATLLPRLPKMMSSGVHHALNEFSVSPGIDPKDIPAVDIARMRRALSRVNNGQFMTAHFPAHPDLPALLEDLGYRSVLIVRDPRDVAVSQTFYVTRLARHFLHRRYNDLYKTDDERLLATITGFASDEYGPGQESIGDRVAKYMAWFDQPIAHVCKFEALVGPAGGGSSAAQHAAIDCIAAHVGRPLDPDAVRKVAAKVWSPRTATFRRGRIGDWRDHFSDEHVAAFKEVAGHHLVALGYDW